MSNYKEKSKGFTLAEVLVTITIIGIVAMQTIPTLIQNTKNASTVAQLRKSYSTLQQAHISFVADGVTMDTVWAGDYNNAEVLNQFATKLNIIKNFGTQAEATPAVNYISLSGDPAGVFMGEAGSAILTDGSMISIGDQEGGCTSTGEGNPSYCGYIMVDINGPNKPPNQYGRDFFMFEFLKEGVFPGGTFPYGPGMACNTSEAGLECASKVLTEGAINY